MGVFTSNFSTPSYFIFKLDFQNDALVSICLLESAVVLGRRQWEQRFPASPEEQGECEGGKSHWKPNSSFEMLKAWMSPSPLLEAGKLSFRCYIPVAPKRSPNFGEICKQDKKSQSRYVTFLNK